MDGIIIPFLPTGLWLFAAGLTVILVLLCFSHFLYYRRRLQAVVDEGKASADLAAERTQKQADVDALRAWIDSQQDELNRLRAEREEQERLRAHLDNLSQQATLQDQKNEGLRREVGELENQRHMVTLSLDKMQQEIGDLEQKRTEASDLNAKIRELKSRIDEAQVTYQNLAGVEAKLLTLKAEQVTLEKQVAEVRASADNASEEAEFKRLETQKASYELEQTKMNLAEMKRDKAEIEAIVNKMNRDKNNLEPRLDYLRREHDDLIKKVDGLRIAAEKTSEELKSKRKEVLETSREAENSRFELSNVRKEKAELDASVNVLVAKKEALANELRQTKDEIVKYNSAKKEVIDTLDELKSLKSERRREQEQVEELVARKALLEQKVEELREKLGEDDATETETAGKAFSDLLVEPACLQPQEFVLSPLQISEMDALKEVQDQLAKEGLIFPERVIKSFHTSLKCADINPLTVLAGVSGTGKTLLPIKYAQLMGMHSLVMAVQPRWDSPQDMFGFYNYLEKKYKATEMAQALVRMDEYHPFMGVGGASKERMLMVIMDEMNLARTEYYFSEFLSKLELRREVNDPSDPSDRKKAEIVLDLGPGSNETSRLWAGSNLLFVGTMNEDESTQSLSDKVLDRSNVLRFGKPANRLASDSKSREMKRADGFLTKELWLSWIHSFDEPTSWSRTVADWTEAVNSALEKIGRPFGYRVEKAIRSYVANYPTNGARDDYKLAFADQIEQKILPKLRGLDFSEPYAAECLTQIQDVVVQLGDKDLSETLSGAIEMGNSSLFLWQGVSR
ncbi:hypothetical protein [uncultured Desulfosarcina sp.]|uniref:hypothetical protein n=1 Tax=uncultured Desulfosarcina sp. TaxID=218289 RepID=UPI0029C7BA17|nr:hypothetical protein [uncultured Desulfosarcina sp.]